MKRNASYGNEQEMNILIVDGNVVFLEIAQWYLSHRGHKARTALNGMACVASLRRHVPDVVVLNRELLWGGCDGVLAVIQRNLLWSQIAVILNSSDELTDVSSSFVVRPSVARRFKPYPLQHLLAHIQASRVTTRAC